jgi:hypothetical protein
LVGEKPGALGGQVVAVFAVVERDLLTADRRGKVREVLVRGVVGVAVPGGVKGELSSGGSGGVR